MIQQTLLRSRGFLIGRRPQEKPATLDPLSVDPEKAPGEQVKMLNGLLQSVCAKLLAKIKELERVKGDLQNLMTVSAIPAVFVDENLLIRRFTPEIEGVYSLTSQDIGRSLLDVDCDLTYGRLEDDFKRLRETGEAVKRYLEQRGGTARYLMRILPSFYQDNCFGGAALTFVKVNSWSSGEA